MVANHPDEDLADLRQRAVALELEAAAETRRYQRATWIRFVGVFFPIPFIVVLLRLEIPAWTYYVWGALILGGGAVLYIVDSRASAKADAAVAAAEKGRAIYEAALARAALTPP